MDKNGIIIRKIMFPLMELLKGNKIRKNLSYLCKTQAAPIHEIEALQAEKLTALLTHCIEKVPAYSNYKHLLPEIKIDPLSVLKKLPVLTKKQFAATSHDFLSTGAVDKKLIANKTGGSTGEPVRFYLDRYTIEFFEAARWRGLSWWDIQIGERCAMIWGSAIDMTPHQRKFYRIKEKYIKNKIMIPAYGLNANSIEDYIRLLNKFKPHYIYGYATALHLFSQLMLKNGLYLDFNLKGIVSTSETLHDFQRKDIEQAFKCKAINEYGARDGGIIAYECPHGHMHISAENAIIEIVDIHSKNPVAPGQTGLLLVTDLNNFSMPRLRYQLGDVAAIASEKYSCDITLPILEKIEGREDDIFVSRNNNFIHGHYFNHIARELNGVKQFQIIQHSRENLTLKIIKDVCFTTSQLEYFKDKVLEAMDTVNLKIEFVDTIPLTSSGKIRYAIREFPLTLG